MQNAVSLMSKQLSFAVLNEGMWKLLVIEEKDPVKYAVFSIDWDGNTNLFSGTLITKDKAYNVVSECKYVFDVFKGLSKVQKSTTLRGVIANYWNTDEFPVDIHQKVIKALPSPTTKLIVGQIHAYFALHLKNSGIQASDREEIFMIDWCKAVCMRPYYLFFKEQNYYNFFAETVYAKHIGFAKPILYVRTDAEKYNVVYLKKYTLNDYLLSPELQLTAETYNEFIQSISNGTNFYGYLIDDFDDINYQAEWENQNIVIHCGIEKLPFEKTTTLDIGDTEWLKVYAVVRNDKYLIKSYTMKTKKPRRVFLTVKQLTLFDITASLFVLESMPADNEIANPLNNIVVNQSNDSPAKPPTLSEVSQSPEEAISSSESPPSPEVIFTFTANNRILVNAGPDYTGDSEFAAYFRMESSKFGPIVTVGEKAKAAYKKHPKTVIYDIPGLLAADSDLSNENLTWSFKTSRAADGTLLIHLGDNACTSPVPLFASVVKSALLHVKEHLTENVKSVGIRLPEASIISEDNLTKISNMLAVILTVL
uniref:FERM domain-containing protein n=1 Tax=Panagrellus redivivus TaxID=6233 RepID=A0A7E4W3C3_PANRE